MKCNNIQETVSNHKYHKKFKLKEAVVLLTDISKTDVYKRYVSSLDVNVPKSKESDSQTKNKDEVVPPKEGVKQEGMVIVKQEKECLKSFSDQLENSNCVGNETFNNSLCSFKTEFKNTWCTDGAPTKFKSLTELAEGCSFSKILARFRLKHKNTNSSENKTLSRDMENENVYCVTQELKNDNLEVHLNNELSVEVNLNETGEVDKGKDVGSCFLQEQENSVFSPKTISNFKEKEDCTSFSCVNHVYKLKPDSSKVTAGSSEMLEVGPRIFTENKINSSAVPISPHQNSLNFPQTNSNKNIEAKVVLHKLNLQNVVGNVKLDDIRREMNRRGLLNSAIAKKQNTSNEKKQAGSPNASSSSVTAKAAKDKVSKKSKKKMRITEDYIPLNSSGPTKFLVAPLNKVTPYKTHSAKDFKEQMLFGNRVNRFSCPDQLQIYRMKQIARKSNK